MKSKSSVPAQNFVEIEELKQNTIILRNGGLRKLLLVNGLNFELKSEEEQGMIIYAFQNFLNSLNFSVEFFIHSRKLNINNYLTKLAKRQQDEPLNLLKDIIGEYQNFIRSFVGDNAIMEKAFFVVVPYNPIQIPVAGKIFFKKMKSWITRRPINDDDSLAMIKKKFDQHLQQLDQRVDSVVSGLSQIGLRTVALNDKEITQLFYNLYNPETTERELSI